MRWTYSSKPGMPDEAAGIPEKETKKAEYLFEQRLNTGMHDFF
jgi:hypothetical protein